MIIDGREIRDEILTSLREEVRSRKHAPELFVFAIGRNLAVEHFIRVKKKYAEHIGVTLKEFWFEEKISTDEAVSRIAKEVREKNRGIVVQLPLPAGVDTQTVLDAIPRTADVDVLSSSAYAAFEEGELAILPPVVGAIKEILFRHGVFVGNKHVVVIGKGRLVGAPAAVWFRRHGSIVSLIDKNTTNAEELIEKADILVSGAGAPGIIKPEMLKDGVVLLDAGTSESKGKLAGDAVPACADKASIFSPVPGGIGPVTVAVLFRNLLTLTENGF